MSFIDTYLRVMGLGGLPKIKSPIDGLDIDMDSEYELIKQKKSRLSSAQRDYIVYQMERKSAPKPTTDTAG
jgi:hypothetical protein